MRAATVLGLAALLLTASVARGQQPPPREAPVIPTFGTASIAGSVVSDESPPRLVRRAVVTLTGDGLRPSRSAITDDGRAPLDAAGLRLKGRLEKVAGSLERVRSKGGHRARSRGSRS